MNILITGVTGFLGTNLGCQLAAEGHIISGTVKSPEKMHTLPAWLRKAYLHNLGSTVDQDICTGIDLVLHLAHDFRPGMQKTNFRGTQELMRAAQLAGVSRQIFCSSCSARPETLSEYGRTKYALEQSFLSADQTVVRPGLVLGNGSLFKRMVQTALRLPVVPLPDGGRQKIPLIDMQTLALAFSKIIQDRNSSRQEWNLFHPEPVTLRSLLEQTLRECGKRPRFLPFPSRLILPPLSLLNRTGLLSAIQADNLKGIMIPSTSELPPHLAELLETIMPSTAMITLALQQIFPK